MTVDGGVAAHEVLEHDRDVGVVAGEVGGDPRRRRRGGRPARPRPWCPGPTSTWDRAAGRRCVATAAISASTTIATATATTTPMARNARLRPPRRSPVAVVGASGGGHRDCSSTRRASSPNRSASSGPVGRLPYQARSNSSAASPKSGATVGSGDARPRAGARRSCATSPGRPPGVGRARRRGPGTAPACPRATGPRPRASTASASQSTRASAGCASARAGPPRRRIAASDRRRDRTASTITKRGHRHHDEEDHPRDHGAPARPVERAEDPLEQLVDLLERLSATTALAGSWYSGPLEDLLGGAPGLVGVSRHGRRRRSPAAGGRGPRCGPAGRGRAARC